MMKFIDSLSFQTKLMLILLIPLSGVIGLEILGIQDKISVIDRMDQIDKITKLAIHISNLVHEIQKERGLTAGLLGSKGEKFRTELALQREKSREKYKQLQEFSSAMKMEHIGVEFNSFFQTGLRDYGQLEKLRQRVDHLAIPFEEAIPFYTKMNEDFLNTIHYLSNISDNVKIANLTKNYNTLLQAKERAGLERAIIANTLTRHRFGPGLYGKFSTLVSEQETLLRIFRTLASPEDQKKFDTLMADPSIQKVQKIRDILFKSGYASSLYVLLGELYQNMALRGAYHSIKNLLIRGSLYGFKDDDFNPEGKQQHYKKQFEKNFQDIQKVMQQIWSLTPEELSIGQRQDVDIIWANILAYRKSVDVIIHLQNQGKHIHEIDMDVESGVKIDDLPAEEAMRRLIKSTAVGQFGVDPGVWFEVSTSKINQLKAMEDHLADDLIARSADLRMAAWKSFIAYLVYGLLLIILSMGVGLYMVRQLKDKTAKILRQNEKIISGDLTVRIQVDNGHTLDELDKIAVSMNHMVESLEKTTQMNQRALLALQVSESRVRSMFESAPDAIISLNSQWKIEAINSAGENLFGYYPGTLIGQPVVNIVPNFNSTEGGRGSWLERFGKNKLCTSITVEMDGVCQDAGYFPVEISLSSYIAEDDRLHFTLILKDITERKQIKAALTKAYNELEERVRDRTRELEQANKQLFAEIEERIRAEQGLALAAKVFETASEGILITDATVNIIKINKAFTNITGYLEQELFGKNPRLMRSGRHEADFYVNMWESIHKTGSWSGEIWNRRKNGEIFPQRLSITSVWNAQDELTNFVGIFSDITHLKETERRLEKMAYFDALTQLPNRLLFRDRLQHELDKKTRHEFKLAVLFIDLDRFKHVNDSLGHSAGDQLLVEVAERIKVCLRKYDTAARLGGDEFAAIITGIRESRDVVSVARKIIEVLKQGFILSGQEVFIGGSIGISLFPDDGDNFEILTKYADIAMYKAKESGRGMFKFYAEATNSGVQDHLMLESNLRNGLKNDEFRVFYQPKVNMQSGLICGMEALVRWFPKQGPMVSPADFIPLAEETGIILALGNWIMREACQQTAIWRKAGHAIKMAINLSAMQFQKNDLIETIQALLDETGLPPEALELEITESMVMGNVEKSIERMKCLKALGLTLAVDDFGTGYSSLNYLKRFPIDTLKIDQSFVRDFNRAPEDYAIVLAIISLGQALKLNIVAEGVETREQVLLLKEKGCHEMQGYFFSKPLAAEKIQNLFDEGQNLDSLLL
ncbi:MAG: EAL domain-containing protein [Magnetococcus sp. DMHC-6]